MAQVNTRTTTLSEIRRQAVARRGSVIVVEDRADVREGLTQLLELHGHVVDDAPDGETALEQLNAAPEDYAVIVLDLLLPGRVSGFDLRQRQLADPALARIPIIVITAAELSAGDRAPLCPDAWLDKPFRFPALLQLVRQFAVPEEAAGDRAVPISSSSSA